MKTLTATNVRLLKREKQDAMALRDCMQHSDDSSAFGRTHVMSNCIQVRVIGRRQRGGLNCQHGSMRQSGSVGIHH